MSIPAPEKTVAQQSEWEYLRLFKQRLALFETRRGLVLLDLRRADQRVRFERILASDPSGASPRQALLLPVPLELEPLAAEALERQKKFLRTHGFEIEAFGRNFYRVESVPAWLRMEDAEGFVRDLIDLLRQRGKSAGTVIWEQVAQLAVKDSYRRSDALNKEQAEQLAGELLRCRNPHTAPDGKPTFTEVSWKEWERRLGGD